MVKLQSVLSHCGYDVTLTSGVFGQHGCDTTLMSYFFQTGDIQQVVPGVSA